MIPVKQLWISSSGAAQSESISRTFLIIISGMLSIYFSSFKEVFSAKSDINDHHLKILSPFVSPLIVWSFCRDCWNYKLFESQVPKRSETTSGKVSYPEKKKENLLPLREKLIQVSTISCLKCESSAFWMLFLSLLYSNICTNRSNQDTWSYKNTLKTKELCTKRQVQSLKVSD